MAKILHRFFDALPSTPTTDTTRIRQLDVFPDDSRVPAVRWVARADVAAGTANPAFPTGDDISNAAWFIYAEDGAAGTGAITIINSPTAVAVDANTFVSLQSGSIEEIYYFVDSQAAISTNTNFNDLTEIRADQPVPPAILLSVNEGGERLFTNLGDTPNNIVSGQFLRGGTTQLPLFNATWNHGSSSSASGEFNANTFQGGFRFNLNTFDTAGTNRRAEVIRASHLPGAVLAITEAGSSTVLVQGAVGGETDFTSQETIFVPTLTVGDAAAVAALDDATDYDIYIGPERTNLEFATVEVSSSFTDLTDTPDFIGAVGQLVSVTNRPILHRDWTKQDGVLVQNSETGRFVAFEQGDNVVFVIHELPTLGVSVSGALVPAANTANAVVIVANVATDEVVFQGNIEANSATDFGQTNRFDVDTITTGTVDDILDDVNYTIYIGPETNRRLDYSNRTVDTDTGEDNNIPDYDPAVLTSGGYAPGSSVYVATNNTAVSATYRGFIWFVPRSMLDTSGEFTQRTTNVTTAPGIGPDWTTRTPIQLADTAPFPNTPPFITLSDIIGTTDDADTDASARTNGGDGFPGTVVESEAGITYVYRPGGTSPAAGADGEGWYYFDGATLDPNDGLTRTPDGEIAVDHTVVATHWTDEREYEQGSTIFFDTGPTGGGGNTHRSYWFTNATITTANNTAPPSVDVLTGPGTYEVGDYAVDEVNNVVRLYVRINTGGSDLPSASLTNWTLTSTNGNWSPVRIDTPSIIPVVDYGRDDYVLNEVVREGNEIYVVTNVTQANNAMDVDNSNSGFFRVGNFDTTHSITYNPTTQELLTGRFTFQDGDTVFLIDNTDLDFERVELYRIRNVGNGLSITNTQFVDGNNADNTFRLDDDDALTQFRLRMGERAVRGDRFGLADATELPEEATFFADREGSVWELEEQQYQRQPDKTGQVQRITRNSAGAVISVAPESTANTNLSDINTLTHSLAGNRNEVSVDVVASAITTVDRRPQGTLSIRFNRANSVGQAQTVDDNDVLSMFAIRGAVLTLLDEGITDTNPQTFRVVDGDTTRYYVCTGIIDRTDDAGFSGGDRENVYRGIELRVRHVLNEHSRSFPAAATFTNVDGLFLFDLAPTGGERIGAGLERDRDGTLHVDLDGSTLDTNGGVLRVSNEGIGDAQLNTGAAVNRVIGEDAITTPKVRDRNITGVKVALRQIGPEHLTEQLQRDIQLDETAVTSHALTGELETGSVISPTFFGDNRDWEMFIRLDGTRYIAFTEDDSVVENFNIEVGDHFTLLAGPGDAPMSGVPQSTNAIAEVPSHTVDSSYTISGAIREVNNSTIELRLINRNGIPASTANPAVIPGGTVFRVNNFVAIVNTTLTITSDAIVTVTGDDVTINATGLVGEQTFRTVTVNHTQTRVELELVIDSMVGDMRLDDYLDLLAPASTSGGEGQLRFQTSGEFYTRSSVWHTPDNQRWVVSDDIVAHQDEFQVTSIRVGNANTGPSNAFTEPLPPSTGDDALTYNDVSVTWTTRPLSGEFNLVWRGNQAEIDAIITALGSTSNRHGIYFNADPDDLANSIAVSTPHIRAISNYAAFLAGDAGIQVLDLILTPGNDGLVTDVGIRASIDELPATTVMGILSNSLAPLPITEVPARVRLEGREQTGFVSRIIPVVNQDVPSTPFDVHTMYYSTANTDEGGSPFARPGSRTPINSVPYLPGTEVQIEDGPADTMDLLFTGPDAQRAADDIVSTFYTRSNSNRGALFFANEGNGFSEVGYSVSIAFASYPTNTRRMVGTAVTAYVAPTVRPQPGGQRTRTNQTTGAYNNTTIAWHRQSNHSFLITVAGNDRMRLYQDILRAFADGQSGDNLSFIVNTVDASVVAAVNDTTTPWLTLDLPDFPSYENEEQQLRTEGVTEPFAAPNSAYAQSGDNQLRLWELTPGAVETIDLTGNRTLTALFGADQTNFVLGLPAFRPGQTIPAGFTEGNSIVAFDRNGQNFPNNDADIVDVLPAGGDTWLPADGPAWTYRDARTERQYTDNFLRNQNAGITTNPTALLSVPINFSNTGSVNLVVGGFDFAGGSTVNNVGPNDVSVNINNNGPYNLLTLASDQQRLVPSTGTATRGNRLNVLDMYALFNLTPPANPSTGFLDIDNGLMDDDGNPLFIRFSTADPLGWRVVAVGERGDGGQDQHGLALLQRISGATNQVAGGGTTIQEDVPIPARLQRLPVTGVYTLTNHTDLQNGLWVRVAGIPIP